MYYTEEELLEAVDILVEEYGFDEDEAIDMIAETYELELLDEGVRNLPRSAKNFKDAVSGTRQVYSKDFAKDYTDEELQYIKDDQKKYLKRQAGHLAKDAAVPAVIAAGALAAGGAYKHHKARKNARRRSKLLRRSNKRRCR